MKCPTCKVEVNEAPPAQWIGFTEYRQPVVQYKCKHGHSITVQLATMASYKAPRAKEYPAKRGEYFRGTADQVALQFCCPLCLSTFGMGAHQILPDGTVTPSVVCPNKCGFHTNVTFLDWAL